MCRFIVRFASIGIVAGALWGLGCAGAKSETSNCQQYRDNAIERRLDGLSLPDLNEDKLHQELEKHRAVMVKVHGDRLIKECEQKAKESR